MTESTSSGTQSRLRSWWRTRPTEAKAGVISAILAVIALLGSGTAWGLDHLRADAAPGPATVAHPTTPAPANPAPTNPATPASATDGRFVADLDLVGGSPAQLPDELDAAQYPHAIAAHCPSNQTGDTTTTLTYDLDRRYRTFTATVTGWADTKNPDPIGVRVSIRTEQIDGTFVTTEQSRFNGVVNQPGGALTAKVKDANELALSIECHRPNGVVILSDAQVHG